MNNNEEIQKYVEKRIRESGNNIPTIDELNGFLAEWMQITNSRPLVDFEGYSPSEMQLIIYNLFEENCPIQFANFDEEVCDFVPLFRQANFLLKIIEKEENLKLTKTGNLPPRIVKEMYPLGTPDLYIQEGITVLRTEKDSISVQMARIAVELMGVVKKRSNSLSLTNNGKKLIKDNRRLLTNMLTVLLTKFNLAYFDYFSSDSIGLVAPGYSLVLLKRYGKKERRDTFYSDKYFTTFPILLEEVEERYRSREEIANNCYSNRIFNLLFNHLGLVTIKENKDYTREITKLIRRTTLFETLFTFKHVH